MSSTRTQTRPTNKKFMAAKIALGVIGAGAGFLYKGPSEVCITQPECGLWLANALTPKVARAIFTAGGADYSIINAYMSFNSLDRLKAYLDKKSSTKEKVGKGALILLFGATLNTGLLLTTLTTSKVWWESTLTTLGGLPGSFYAAVGLTENQLPAIAEAFQRGLLVFKKNIVDHIVSPTPHEVLMREYYEAYRQQKYEFTKNLNRNLNYRKRHYEDYPSMDTDLLVSLAQQIDEYKPSTARKIVRYGSQTLGSVTGIYISAVFAKNTYQNTHRFIPIMPLALIISAFLSISSFYNNLVITGHGARDIADLVVDGLTGATPEDLSASFRPKTTALVALIALTLSVFSYAVINLIFNADFKQYENNTAHDDFRIAADVGIDLYHFFGIMHFWGTIYSLLPKEGHEAQLATAEALVKKFEAMTLEEFIAYVSNNTPDYNGKLSVQKFEKPIPDEKPEYTYDSDEDQLLEDRSTHRHLRQFSLFNCCRRGQETQKLLTKSLNFA